MNDISTRQQWQSWFVFAGDAPATSNSPPTSLRPTSLQSNGVSTSAGRMSLVTREISLDDDIHMQRNITNERITAARQERDGWETKERSRSTETHVREVSSTTVISHVTQHFSGKEASTTAVNNGFADAQVTSNKKSSSDAVAFIDDEPSDHDQPPSEDEMDRSGDESPLKEHFDQLAKDVSPTRERNTLPNMERETSPIDMPGQNRSSISAKFLSRSSQSQTRYKTTRQETSSQRQLKSLCNLIDNQPVLAEKKGFRAKPLSTSPTSSTSEMIKSEPPRQDDIDESLLLAAREINLVAKNLKDRSRIDLEPDASTHRDAVGGFDSQMTSSPLAERTPESATAIGGPVGFFPSIMTPTKLKCNDDSRNENRAATEYQTKDNARGADESRVIAEDHRRGESQATYENRVRTNSDEGQTKSRFGAEDHAKDENRAFSLGRDRPNKDRRYFQAVHDDPAPGEGNDRVEPLVPRRRSSGRSGRPKSLILSFPTVPELKSASSLERTNSEPELDTAEDDRQIHQTFKSNSLEKQSVAFTISLTDDAEADSPMEVSHGTPSKRRSDPVGPTETSNDAVMWMYEVGERQSLSSSPTQPTIAEREGDRKLSVETPDDASSVDRTILPTIIPVTDETIATSPGHPSTPDDITDVRRQIDDAVTQLQSSLHALTSLQSQVVENNLLPLQDDLCVLLRSTYEDIEKTAVANRSQLPAATNEQSASHDVQTDKDGSTHDVGDLLSAIEMDPIREEEIGREGRQNVMDLLEKYSDLLLKTVSEKLDSRASNVR